MKLGVTLPSFRHDASALDAARAAEEAGIDGVFVFDHLWPMGRPDRPALAAFVLLGALAASTRRVALGTLVARVGLVDDGILVGQFASLDLIAPGRVIAGLGSGDAKSAAENEAYGYARRSAEDRRSSMEWCAQRLAGMGIPVWIGAGDGSGPSVGLARRLGVAVNLWSVHPVTLGSHAASGEVTWGGTVPADPEAAEQLVAGLSAGGASWMVATWPEELGELGRLVSLVRAAGC